MRIFLLPCPFVCFQHNDSDMWDDTALLMFKVDGKIVPLFKSALKVVKHLKILTKTVKPIKQSLLKTIREKKVEKEQRKGEEEVKGRRGKRGGKEKKGREGEAGGGGERRRGMGGRGGKEQEHTTLMKQ